MRTSRSLVAALLLVPVFTVVNGQDTTDYVQELVAEEDASWVEYRGGFDFREGIYRTFLEFRLNAPSLPLSSLVDSEGQPINDLRTFDGRVYVADSTGKRVKVDEGRAWGFCNNNAIYVASAQGFVRMGMLGSLGHTVVEVWRVQSIGLMDSGTPVLVDQLLNMRTGKWAVFNASSLREGISDDAPLIAEFEGLPKRQRNKPETLFQFLRRYNERHPLRFPPS
ncbi:MAG: hypothetical protein ABI599_00360 [Flavobacteriales bacterium]